MSAPRKPREEAVLKNLPPARQASLFTYMEGEGEEPGHSYKDCIAWLAADGIRVDKERLRKWRDWYYLRLGFQQSRDDARTLLESEAEEGEVVSEEKIQRVGNQIFAMRAIKDQDVKAWYLSQKISLEDRKESTRQQALALLRQKVQRESCKLFITWLENKRAVEIASSAASNSDKIEQLGQAMFGEDWK